tara:strand:- start:2016 stop:2939 length:924 start_codon:yes stop_codon:yes gene_type:complete
MAHTPPIFIVENGTGVAGANAYAEDAFVAQYLADQGRGEGAAWENIAADGRSSAIIQATSHIENRFRQVFNGTKALRDIRLARSTLTFTANALDTETVVVGSITYTIRDTIAAANDVLRGASSSATLSNLVAAIMATPSSSGVEYHADTVINPDAGAQVFTGDTLLAYGKLGGTADNAVATTTTVTGGSWNFATLHGGTDILTPQPLSFPRAGLVDRDGITILGIPLLLKQATAEYAERAAAALLAPDPTVDALGGTVTRLKEKVGPIETDVNYLPGTAGSGALPAYPAADRLLRDFIRAGGVAIRA